MPYKSCFPPKFGKVIFWWVKWPVAGMAGWERYVPSGKVFNSDELLFGREH